MAYIVFISDHPDREFLREPNAKAHYAYLEASQHLILLRGGLVDEKTKSFFGGVLVLDLPSKEAVAEFVANDPFAKAGMQGEVRIERFNPAYCAPETRWREK